MNLHSLSPNWSVATFLLHPYAEHWRRVGDGLVSLSCSSTLSTVWRWWLRFFHRVAMVATSNLTQDRRTPKSSCDNPLVHHLHNLADDVAFHIGQAKVTAVVAKGESFVIEAEEMQDRCMKIMHVDWVHYRLMTYFIG